MPDSIHIRLEDEIKKDFAKDAIFSVVGYGVLVLFSLGFNFFAARSLGVIQYGIYTSFFYLLLAFSQPINSFQLAVAKFTDRHKLDAKHASQQLASTIFIFSLIIIGVFAVFSPLLKMIYNLNNIGEAIVGDS